MVEMGTFMHAVEDEMLCLSIMPDKVPYFNAPIYLQNKSVIGRVDEILGPINEVYFSVKMGDGMVASSFKKGDKVYIGGDKLLPLERFLPKPKVAGGTSTLPLPPSPSSSLSSASPSSPSNAQVPFRPRPSPLRLEAARRPSSSSITVSSSSSASTPDSPSVYSQDSVPHSSSSSSEEESHGWPGGM